MAPRVLAAVVRRYGDFDAAEDAIFVHDWDSGRIVDVNPKACATYGFTADEFRLVSIEEISSGVPPYTTRDALRWIERAYTKAGRSSRHGRK